MPEPARAGPPRAFLLWALVWTAVVLPFDVIIGVTAVRQVWALTYPEVEGVVVRSGVATGDGVNRPAIAYEYEVGGVTHTGTRYSYGEMGTDTRAWHRVAAELPVGTPVLVRYDPSDPSESLLLPGLNGFIVSMIWFLTPFNIVAAGGWVWFLNSRPFDPNDRRTVRPIKGGYRVRLPGVGRAACGAALMLVVAFGCSFLWAFGYGFNPPAELAGWLYVALVAVAVALSAWVPVPPAWLEVRERARVVRFPATPDPVDVPFASIRDAVVRREEKTDTDGQVSSEYHVEFARADADPFHVATYSDRGSAEALAAWLRERLGLKAEEKSF